MCPSCNSDLVIRAFPALLARRSSVDVAALRIEGGEASCYNHPSKRAASACSQCGRFLCALCVVEFDGAAWCPDCLAAGSARRKVANLETHRTLYDSIALALAVWPGILVYPPLITGPLTIYLSIRYWKSPSSIIPRNKWRFVVAIMLAVAELAFLVLVIAIFISAARKLQSQP